jgi:hypothetical protein
MMTVIAMATATITVEEEGWRDDSRATDDALISAAWCSASARFSANFSRTPCGSVRLILSAFFAVDEALNYATTLHVSRQNGCPAISPY